jgi:hypothetical protein
MHQNSGKVYGKLSDTMRLVQQYQANGSAMQGELIAKQ